MILTPSGCSSSFRTGLLFPNKHSWRSVFLAKKSPLCPGWERGMRGGIAAGGAGSSRCARAALGLRQEQHRLCGCPALSCSGLRKCWGCSGPSSPAENRGFCQSPSLGSAPSAPAPAGFAVTSPGADPAGLRGTHPQPGSCWALASGAHPNRAEGEQV